MPVPLAVLIPLITAGIGAGTSIYTSHAAGEQAHDAQKHADEQAKEQAAQAAADAQKAKEQQAQQELQTKQQALLANRGNAQGQTGGALSDESFNDLTALLAGYPSGGAFPGTTEGSTGGSTSTSTLAGLPFSFSGSSSNTGGTIGAFDPEVLDGLRLGGSPGQGRSDASTDYQLTGGG